MPTPQVMLIDSYTHDDGSRTVYSQSMYFGDWNSINIDIRRRIEGSCEIHAFGSYGKDFDEQAKKTARALDCIDRLKGIEGYRPTTEYCFTAREAIAPVTSAAQAQAAVDAFIASRGNVPLSDLSSLRVHFNDVSVSMSQDDRDRGRGLTIECSIGKAADAEDYSRPYVYAGDVDDAFSQMWGLYDDLVSGRVTEQSPTPWTQMMRDIVGRHSSPEDAAAYARLDEKLAQETEEQKDRLRRNVALSDLGNLDRFIDVKALLEADPFFDGQVDEIMADCERAKEAHERLISEVAGVIREHIVPIEGEDADTGASDETGTEGEIGDDEDRDADGAQPSGE